MSATTLQLALDDLVGLLQLVLQDQVVRQPAEQAADPDPLRELVGVERRRLPLQQDDHVERHALVVVRDRHQRAEAVR